MYSPPGSLQRSLLSVAQVPAFLDLSLPWAPLGATPSGVQYLGHYSLVSMHMDGKGVIQIEEILEIRAIVPPLVVTVHAASADWGMPPQIAARRGRKIYDFIAYFFVGVNAEWPVR